MKYFRKMIEKFITVNDQEWQRACEGFTKVTAKKEPLFIKREMFLKTSGSLKVA